MNEAPSPQTAPFRARTAIILAVGGILAFAVTLVLAAYAPDLRSDSSGGGHALSNSAIGLSGLVALAEKTGRNPYVVRDLDELDDEDLAVISPANAKVPMDDVVGQRGARATLYIFPKWQVSPDAKHPGWVRGVGLMSHELTQGVFAPDWDLKVHRRKGRDQPLRSLDLLADQGVDFREPPILQSLSGKDLEPLIVDDDGAVVLGRKAKSQIYVLADPDLVNNMGLADPAQARAALALLDALNSTDAAGILFDVTSNGITRGRSPLRLMFDPPFLAVTIALFGAFLLAAWQATVRFGQPIRRARAIAFGKSALVDNSAALVRRAGRETDIGRRYVDVVRARAARWFRLGPVGNATLDERLDALAPTPFSSLAAAAEGSRTRAEMLAAAQQLHRWIKEIEQ